MSNQNGGPTGPVPTELDELAAARSRAFEKSEALWVAYQKAPRREKDRARTLWQEAEIKWLRAQKAWLNAFDAWAAEKGYSGDAPAHGAPAGDAP